MWSPHKQHHPEVRDLVMLYNFRATSRQFTETNKKSKMQSGTTSHFCMLFFIPICKSSPDFTDRAGKVTSLAADHIAVGSGIKHDSISLQNFTSLPHTLRYNPVFFPSTVKRTALTNISQRCKRSVLV